MSFHSLLDYFPVNCLLCGVLLRSGPPFCAACRTDLVRNTAACPRCALTHAGPPGSLCGECLREPPPWQSAWAPFRYAEPLSALLGAFKFRGRIGLGQVLGWLMVQELGDIRPGSGLIVPVPLHPARLAERGYNQALELARPLSGHTGLPLNCCWARRTRHTPRQSELSATERRRNLRGAFALELPAGVDRVVLLDDVMTTGTTLAELTRAAQRAGVREVVVWALARAGRGGV